MPHTGVSISTGIRGFIIAALLISISACQPDIVLPIEALSGKKATPAEGYAQKTVFHFNAEFDGNQHQFTPVLLLWSPDVDNHWDWHVILMQRQQGNLYHAETTLAEHSADYQYRYALQHNKTGEIFESDTLFSGPQLLIDHSDQRLPTVHRTNPASGSTGVAPDREIHFVFNKMIDPVSVHAGNINTESTVEHIAAYQNRVVVRLSDPEMAPSQLFDQKAIKRLLSIQDVADLSGNVMTEPHTLEYYLQHPEVQSWAIENRKYPGYCLSVRDVKKRFADPQQWNPVVELTRCEEINDDYSQRWFMEKTPGENGSGNIRWAANFDYCLSKRAYHEPVIERCDNNKQEQRFSLNPRNSYYLIESDHGGCVAAGVIDVGEKHKVESSLCGKILPRNHWYTHAREKQPLTPAFMIGNFNISFADIRYKNPLHGVDLDINETRDLVKYLYQTHAINKHTINEELQLIEGVNAGSGFAVANPYFPRYQGNDIDLPKPRSVMVDGVEVTNPEGYDNTREGYGETDKGIEWYQQEAVSRWFSDVSHGRAADDQVCAVRFVDGSDTDYEMRTFSNKAMAEMQGWIITHQHKCGTCSTLKDLAVYIGIPDQTTPVRLCAKRGQANNDNLDQVKQCLQESVGFSEMCAESWAYNAIHTGQQCQSTCLKTYGNDALFSPVLRGFFKMVVLEKFDACPPEEKTDDPVLRKQMQQSGCPLANENTGKMNACLWCDERFSGPGFKYSAARTRRGSGLESAIPRPNDRLYYEADHTLYFQ